MVRCSLPVSCTISLLLLADACGAAGTPNPAETDPSPATPADQMVDAALRSELGGRNAERNALLQQVLEQSPDHPQAHWHVGDIKVDGKWMPYARVVDDVEDRWRKLYLYRKTRSERGDTVDDHFFMADGAHERALWDEERAHLKRIVELDWENQEARLRLGDVHIDGFWVARDDVVELIRGIVRTFQSRAAWDPTVQPIARRLLRSRQQARDMAWEELTAFKDPAALPSVEAALAAGNEQAALWYLDWLDGLDAWEAAVALGRQAMLAPSATVRSMAQQRLKKRRVDDYVFVLLGALKADPEFASRLFITPLGGLMYVEHLRFETQDSVQERNLAVLYGPENTDYDTLRPLLVSQVPLANQPQMREQVLVHLRQRYQPFTPLAGRNLTSGTEVQNDRVTRTLATVLERPGLTTPQQWWDWWNGYQQVYVAGPKPQIRNDYEEFWTVDRRRRIQRTPAPQVFSVPRASCFAAGTPVVTEYGPKPIDEVQLGDRVLSQDVETGELAFKPVFKTTVRPPVALMKITTDQGDLVCTGGHPFWVNGESWLYARELQPGMRFHSIDGASEILSVADAGREEQAHNLVVADFHTYFAGEGRILSHDNTPRAPTNALVPGLMPDYAEALGN